MENYIHNTFVSNVLVIVSQDIMKGRVTEKIELTTFNGVP